MVKRLLALFLLVNVVGVAANLPRIIQAVDGSDLRDVVSRWAVGVSTATGDLLDEANADPLTPEDVAQIQEDLRNDTLDDPLDDESVAALVDLWRVLEQSGAQLQADDLRDLLREEGIDPVEGSDPSDPATPSSAASPPAADPSVPPLLGDDAGRSALDALQSGDGLDSGTD